MAESTRVRIVNVVVDVRSSDAELIRQIITRYDNFLDPQGEPEITMDLEVAGLIEEASQDPEIFEDGDALILQRRDFQVRYDPATGHVKGRVTCNMYCFDSFLRVLFSLLLRDRDGFLIHGSSIKREEKSFIFFGVSGSGKTTVAKLSPEYQVLSDEITAVRKVNGVYHAFGTPFWGELRKNGENISAPIGALCLLTKDKNVFLDRMSGAMAVSKILPCILFFSTRKSLMNKVVDQCVEAATTVRCYDMHFLPDNSFWRVIADVAG